MVSWRSTSVLLFVLLNNPQRIRGIYGVWYLTSIVGYCTLLFSINVLGSFTCLGMTLPIHGTNSGIRAMGDTQSSNVESHIFLHLTNFTALVEVEVRTTNLCTAGQRVTAQPHSSLFHV